MLFNQKLKKQNVHSRYFYHSTPQYKLASIEIRLLNTQIIHNRYLRLFFFYMELRFISLNRLTRVKYAILIEDHVGEKLKLPYLTHVCFPYCYNITFSTQLKQKRFSCHLNVHEFIFKIGKQKKIINIISGNGFNSVSLDNLFMQISIQIIFFHITTYLYYISV